MTPNRFNVSAETHPRALIGPRFAVAGEFDAINTGSSDFLRSHFHSFAYAPRKLTGGDVTDMYSNSDPPVFSKP